MKEKCSICGRKLSNPVSMYIGIGPVCRSKCRYKHRKRKDSQQGVLDFMHAQFEVIRHERGKFIFIRDIGHETGRSVTNDADYVIEQLYLGHGIDDETRIFYEDSDSKIDEILHTRNKFDGFLEGHKGVDL